MKVILKEDIKKLGKKGAVIEVKDGYAKNFLIHNNKAVAYTSRSAEILSLQTKEKARIEAEKLNEAKKTKISLEKLNLKFYLKENNGKFFGSISPKQIEREINDNNIKIERKKIEPKGGIHSLGEHKLYIKLHHNVTAELVVNVDAK